MPLKLLMLALAVGFCGCTHAKVSIDQFIAEQNASELTAPPEGKGLIIVIREKKISRMLGRYIVFLDSNRIGILPNGAHLNFAVEPGNRTLRIVDEVAKHGSAADRFRGKMGRKTFNVEAGKTYYFGYSITLGEAITIKPLTDEVGQVLLAKTQQGEYGPPEIKSAPPVLQQSAPAAVSKPSLPAVLAPSYRQDPHADDFAVVVGIEKYSTLPKASFAERDAQAVASHMRALGIPSRHVIHLAGSKASYTSLKKYVDSWLPRNVKPTSRVFFYFSGHGAPDVNSGQAYLVPWDGDPSFLKDTAYPVKRLYASFSKLKAKEVIIALDACFSGAGGRSVLAEGARPLVTKVDMGKTEGKLTLLTASSANEITTTLKEEGHGIFTYFLLKGLNGDAKNDRGNITTKSLYDYLKPKVQDEARLQNREQTPTLQSSASVVLRDR